MTDPTFQKPISQENISPSVGQILKAARLERGLTLEKISKTLFITPRQLFYLEEDADHLVCDVYTLGFLKLYAQYLDLNAQDLAQKFKDKTVPHASSSQLIFPAPLPGRGMPSLRIVALSLLVLAAIVIGWKWGSNYSIPSYFYSEVILDPAPLPIQQSKLSEAPKEEEMPIEDDHSVIESINLILKTAHLEEEYPIFGDRMFPVSRKFGVVEWNLPHYPEE